MSDITLEEKRLDPRVKRTRQLLLQALTALLAEKSFEAITVQDIAERATVNRVTFYAHFADKFALLEYALRSMFQAQLRAVLPEGTLFSPMHLARLIQLVAETLIEIHGHCPPPRGQMDNLMEKQVKAAVAEVLLAWQRSLPVAAGARRASAEEAAMITTWAIYGAAAHWSAQPNRDPAPAFAQRVLPLILASFRPPA